MIQSTIGVNLFYLFLVTAFASNIDSSVTQEPEECPQSVGVTCPDNTNMHFVLFTRSNPTIGQTLDVATNNIVLSHFNAANPTKIFIHGFSGNINTSLYVDFRSAYITKGEYNVIMVDWSYLAKMPVTCYPSAYINTRHVGECTGGLIQLLRHSYNMTDVHVIGHSLGAVTLNSVVKYVDPKLPRVTGLDPSGSKSYNGVYTAVETLDIDADFVDVIHTNTMDLAAFGRIDQVGDVDFYVNDAAIQPGCEDQSGALERAKCSHRRAILLFTESINNDTGFYGNQCASLEEFTTGECSTAQPRNILMGEYVLNTTRGVVAVPTGAKSPFALGP